MSALTFTLKQQPDQRVDMSPLVCQKLADMPLAEIAALTLQNGKRKIRVDELFGITGSDAQNIVIKEQLRQARFYRQGAGWRAHNGRRRCGCLSWFGHEIRRD